MALLVEDVRTKRRLLRCGQQPGRGENVFAQIRRPALPVGQRSVLAGLETIVQRSVRRRPGLAGERNRDRHERGKEDGRW